MVMAHISGGCVGATTVRSLAGWVVGQRLEDWCAVGLCRCRALLAGRGEVPLDLFDGVVTMLRRTNELEM